jgi:hypothetical protein
MEMRWYHAGQRRARVTVTCWQVESVSQRPLQHAVLVEQAEPVPLHSLELPDTPVHGHPVTPSASARVSRGARSHWGDIRPRKAGLS